MSEATAEITRALKHARQAARMSQRALAALVGIPQSHISRIESGVVDAQISTLVGIARVLGCDFRLVPRSVLPGIDSLIGRADPTRPAGAQTPAYRLDDDDA